MIIDQVKILFINILLALFTIIPQHTLSMGLTDQPQSLLPHEIQTDTEKTISNLLFRKLFKYEEGQLVNDLVEKWTVNENNTEYVFKIKPNQHWQDGNLITSDDVLYSLTMQNDLKNEINIEKISKSEIKITLPTPTAILPSVLTFGIEPSHLQNQDKLKPVGSSSFRISKISREQNKIQSITLQSFQKNKPFNKVKFSFYETENDLQTAYKLGEISAFLSNSPFEYSGINHQSVTFIGRYFALIFNSESEKLQDPEIRKILSNNINKTELLNRSYYANAITADGSISNSIYTKAALPEEENNGIGNQKFNATQKKLVDSLKILLPNNSDGRQIETYLKSTWEKNLEISLEFEYLLLDDMVNKSKDGKFDVMFIGHEVTPDPDRYSFWHSTQINILNLGKFSDLRADKALEEGRKTWDETERAKHYNIFQDVMTTKIPAIFLYHPGSYLYTSEKTPLSVPKLLYYPSGIIKNL